MVSIANEPEVKATLKDHVQTLRDFDFDPSKNGDRKPLNKNEQADSIFSSLNAAYGKFDVDPTLDNLKNINRTRRKFHSKDGLYGRFAESTPISSFVANKSFKCFKNIDDSEEASDTRWLD